MKRHGKEGVTIAGNYATILQEIDRHAHFFANVEKPNQTHDHFVSYDISCNEDFALHAKFHQWQEIFEFFRDHDVAMASLATKTIPHRFLDFNPEGKVRIRFSLMPQRIADLVEPNTAKIQDRLNAIDEFIDAGYDVHVNFSPIILYKGWEEDYEDLFIGLAQATKNTDIVKAECIMLTHNEKKHLENLKNERPGEHLLWRPEIQEPKISQFGGQNVRYKYGLKAQAINQFRELHDRVIPWNTIRYIF